MWCCQTHGWNVKRTKLVSCAVADMMGLKSLLRRQSTLSYFCCLGKPLAHAHKESSRAAAQPKLPKNPTSFSSSDGEREREHTGVHFNLFFSENDSGKSWLHLHVYSIVSPYYVLDFVISICIILPLAECRSRRIFRWYQTKTKTKLQSLIHLNFSICFLDIFAFEAVFVI